MTNRRATAGGIVLGLTVALGLAATTITAAVAQSTPVRACLYNSRSFSDGAYLCAQKSLMLVCSEEAGRPTWKIVADREIANRCVAPLAQDAPVHRRPSFRRTRLARAVQAPAAPISAKCFSFNGRRYCE